MLGAKLHLVIVAKKLNYLRRLDLESGFKVKHVSADIKRFITVNIKLSVFGTKRRHMPGLPKAFPLTAVYVDSGFGE